MIFLGLLPVAFGAGQVVLGFNWNESLPPSAMVATSDGGFIATVGPDVMKFDGMGRRDPAFVSALSSTQFYPNMLVSAPDEGVFVGPHAVVGAIRYGVVKLALSGSVDAKFKPVLITGASQTEGAAITAIASDYAGGVYIGGTFTSLNSISAPGLAHVDENGTVSPIRSNRLGVNTPIFIARIKGGLLIAQENDAFIRFDSGWERDLEKPSKGEWRWIGRGGAIDPNYGIALSVSYLRNGVVENVVSVWNFDGSLKHAFESKVIFGPTPLSALQWDRVGRLIGIGGRVADEGSAVTDDGSAFGPKRLMADGSLDPHWSRTLGLNGQQSSACVLSSGEVIVGGVFSRVGMINRSLALKLTSDFASVSASPQLSARGSVAPQRPLIMGLVVPDNGVAVDVLIRAVSSSLSTFGVTETVSATRFSLFRGQERLGFFTHQNASKNASFVGSQAGAFPIASTQGEAQALINLMPGAYTIVIDGRETERGEVLGEVYFPR